MGRIKEYIKMWIEPRKEKGLEELLKKYNVPAEEAELLLRSANGLKFTNYSIEEIEKKKKRERLSKSYPVDEHKVIEEIAENVKKIQNEHNSER